MFSYHRGCAVVMHSDTCLVPVSLVKPAGDCGQYPTQVTCAQVSCPRLPSPLSGYSILETLVLMAFQRQNKEPQE